MEEPSAFLYTAAKATPVYARNFVFQGGGWCPSCLVFYPQAKPATRRECLDASDLCDERSG